MGTEARSSIPCGMGGWLERSGPVIRSSNRTLANANHDTSLVQRIPVSFLLWSYKNCLNIHHYLTEGVDGIWPVGNHLRMSVLAALLRETIGEDNLSGLKGLGLTVLSE